MALDFSQLEFIGPALPAPFVKFDLETELRKEKLIPKTTGDEGDNLQREWETYRRHLRSLVSQGGPIRVKYHVIDPIVKLLGYTETKDAGKVFTQREGDEDGGYLMITDDGKSHLRFWSIKFDDDLDAPTKRGAAYRYSALRIAERVLLASGERVGLLTNGVELRIIISDPARNNSQIIIPVDTHWKRTRSIPDSFLLLLALCSPDGVKAVPEIVDKARLKQARVTKELRVQARQAIERFMQEILDNPANTEILKTYPNKSELAKTLWREGLIIVYRLLFILKGESIDDIARHFLFASASLWRNTYSPSTALAKYARDVLDDGKETGSMLEDGFRALFKMFSDGVKCSELNVAPLGGALFGANTTPLLESLKWGERAVAHILDRLLWTEKKRGQTARERVYYGPLDVEDLGRVYEALLELEPGITTEPMCRLRRAKLEVVLPVAQGEKYRPKKTVEPDELNFDSDSDEEPEEVEEEEEKEETASKKKTKVEFIEEIPPGKFYLRVGLGRKTTGSYYTPHSFVRFLVQETCGPLCDEVSPPKDNPKPIEILKLKVLDPAMGSGHFLVEACRFLGEKLYEACRQCDTIMLSIDREIQELERQIEKADKKEKEQLEKKLDELKTKYREYHERLVEIPDPNDEILSYLPSTAPEREESGYSEKKALALCKRLIAVNCLYGVDKNPLAVELAKLSLWLESHSEGLPLTFLDHRLVVGDSLTGPFWTHLIKYPGSQQPIENLFMDDLDRKFSKTLSKAVMYTNELQASVGKNLLELENKKRVKEEMDRALAPFKVLAAAWSGGVMLGENYCDDHAYAELVKFVGETGDLPEIIDGQDILKMIAKGLGIESVPPERDKIYEIMGNGNHGCIPALSYDLTFPEVFFPNGVITAREYYGFHAVLGNPPWDRMLPADKEFFAAFDFEILNAPTKRERTAIQTKLMLDKNIETLHSNYIGSFRQMESLVDVFYQYQVVKIDGSSTIGKQDYYRLFCERAPQLCKQYGYVGMVVPSAFHANEGATGIRQLYLNKMALKHCYSFENRKQLFEIHRSFKFACIVAVKDLRGTGEFKCAFYLHDDEWLFLQNLDAALLISKSFIDSVGGKYSIFQEIQFNKELEIVSTCYKNGISFDDLCSKYKIKTSREINMSDDIDNLFNIYKLIPQSEDGRREKWHSQLLSEGYLLIHEGKTIYQFNDLWDESPLYVVHINKIIKKKIWLINIKYFRFTNRKVARSTDDRTSIFTFLPPGVITMMSCSAQQNPEKTAYYITLSLCAICNSFIFDWCARQQVAANFQDNIRDGLPVSMIPFGFGSHSALRLCCNHNEFKTLWQEQLGNEWREPKKPSFTWPVLETEQERWEVRSAIDAVVADAYGLNREQYEHVLRSFVMPKRGPNPHAGICLEKFDELKKIGLGAFTKKYDPYWDVPLNENLPKPVIEIPGLDELLSQGKGS